MASIRTFNRLSLSLALALIVVAVALTFIAGRIAATRAEAQLAAEAAENADLLGALLASEIEHYRALPLVLASDEQVAAALLTADAAARLRLSDRLASMSRDIGAAAVYLIGADGTTIAASNAREPGSFVGGDYRFRQYFSAAMARGTGFQFALGTTTRRPGLYLSQRVNRAGRAIGVIVVKVEFDKLEASWARSGTIALVTDARGEILITTQRAWRFEPVARILPEKAAGVASHSIGAATGAPPGTYTRAATATIIPGWTLHALQRGDDRIASAVTGASALMLLACALAGAALFWIVLRQRRAAVRAQADEAARRELEARVDQRTAELSESNRQLLHEMAERQRIEEAARLLHEELEQANRLTILGQIAAGVTHEINQPVAAIRATADNAAVLLEQSQGDAAQAAVRRIAELTDRIGSITGELRAFAAKGTGGASAISVEATLDGALQLVGANLRQAGIRMDRAPSAAGLTVWAEKIRVEQILVNLLRNAIDALEGRADPAIAIRITATADQVHYRVSDNGPGIAAQLADQLFTPFRTTKAQGLGLGLVISRDIAASLGGALNLVPAAPGDGGGAVFDLVLPRGSA